MALDNDALSYTNEQGRRARKLFAAVVLAALDDAIKDEKTYGTGKGAEGIARWANSRDGQEVLTNAGIEVNSLLISREEKTVYLNNHGFKLTDAAMETLSILAEARLDDEMLTGAAIEAMISGRRIEDCDEAAGATRIKRLRDTLGNQLVSELLVRNIARRGYMLSVGKDVIRVL